MTSGLALENVRAGYGPVEALHDLTVQFPLGSFVALVGRNGAGKSTLLRVLAGIVPVRAGRVRWNGDDITDLPTHRRVDAGLTLVPDDPNVFLGLTVTENLELLGGGASPDAAYTAFPELGRARRRRAATLSGGERQMLALARPLLRPGNALLLDEASRGLSVGAVARLYQVLAELASPTRVIVVVEQYLPDALRRADLVYVLRRGELAWAGEPGELGAPGGGPAPAELV